MLDTAAGNASESQTRVDSSTDYLGHRHRSPGAILLKYRPPPQKVGFAFQCTQVRTRRPPLEGTVLMPPDYPSRFVAGYPKVHDGDVWLAARPRSFQQLERCCFRELGVVANPVKPFVVNIDPVKADIIFLSGDHIFEGRVPDQASIEVFFL
jgi:hypothetical protein